MKNQLLSGTEIVFVTLLGIFGTVAWGLYIGQDLGPDMLNYHLYSGYLSFHKERLATDIFPASLQGYMNPYAYGLVYWLYNVLPPIGVGVVLGALHGLCFISAYVVARMLFEHWSIGAGRFAALLCAGFGVMNPFFLGMVGSSFSDNLTPPLILIPLALVMVMLFPSTSNATGWKAKSLVLPLMAGLLIGAAVGIKLVNAIYVIGLLVACLACARLSKENILRGVVLFGAVGLGFLIIDGEWMWRLYSEFQSPTFPVLNNIFKSKMFAVVPELTNKPVYPPAAATLHDVIAYPFRWMVGIPPFTEWYFRDARFAVLSMLAVLLLLTKLMPSSHKKKTREWPSKKYNIFIYNDQDPAYIQKRCWFIAVWSVTSYAVWIVKFGTLRYLMPVTLLSGLLIFLCLIKLVPYRKIALFLFVLFIVILLSFKENVDFGRVDWIHSWYPIQLPAELASSKNTLYLQGYSASSLLIPFLPQDATFINLPDIANMKPSDGLRQRADSMVKNHQGPIRTVTMIFPMRVKTHQQLERLGLRRIPDDCVDFMVSVYYVQSCRAERLSNSASGKALPVPLDIRFDQHQSRWVDYVLGFYGQEPNGMWTQGDTAVIDLAGVLPKRFKLKLNIPGVIGDNSTLPIKVIIGDQEKEFTLHGGVKTAEIPFVLTSSNENRIVIKVPKPTSPYSMDHNYHDMRMLGIFLDSISIDK